MNKIRTLLILSILGLAGCSTTQVDRYGYYSPVRPSCPDGSMMICEADSLRGCQCSHLIVLN